MTLTGREIRRQRLQPRAAKDARVGHNLCDLAAHANALRRQVIRMVARNGEGYLLQALGAADIFAALFEYELQLDARAPDWSGRDRLILSTAHNSAILYAALAERGFFDAHRLATYGDDGSDLEIIASEQVPGVEGTFGSLGQGLSVAVGTALYAQRYAQDYRTYVVLGDGEMQEGQVWEAAMAAANYKLDNLCLLIDNNDMQVEGAVSSIMDMGDVVGKWQSFGWAVLRVDGHDLGALVDCLDRARRCEAKPAALIADTCPGKGVSFLEGRKDHYAKLNAEDAQAALVELGEL